METTVNKAPEMIENMFKDKKWKLWRMCPSQRDCAWSSRPVILARTEKTSREAILKMLASSPSDSRLSVMEHLQGMLALLQIKEADISPATKEEVFKAAKLVQKRFQGVKRSWSDVLDEEEKNLPEKLPRYESVKAKGNSSAYYSAFCKSAYAKARQNITNKKAASHKQLLTNVYRNKSNLDTNRDKAAKLPVKVKPRKDSCDKYTRVKKKKEATKPQVVKPESTRVASINDQYSRSKVPRYSITITVQNGAQPLNTDLSRKDAGIDNKREPAPVAEPAGQITPYRKSRTDHVIQDKKIEQTREAVTTALWDIGAQLKMLREEAEKSSREEAKKSPREEADESSRIEAEKSSREEAEKSSRKEAKKSSREEAEKSSREEAEKSSRIKAEKSSREEAEKSSREEVKKSSREEAEKSSREEAEKSYREEAEKSSRKEIEKPSREVIEKASIEKAAKSEKSSREAAEKSSREEAEKSSREEAEKFAREVIEKSSREEAEKSSREEAQKLLSSREVIEKSSREEAENSSREEAERSARERAEKSFRERAERSFREKTEKSSRKKVEKSFREEVEKSSIQIEQSQTPEAAKQVPSYRKVKIAQIQEVKQASTGVVLLPSREKLEKKDDTLNITSMQNIEQSRNAAERPSVTVKPLPFQASKAADSVPPYRKRKNEQNSSQPQDVNQASNRIVLLPSQEKKARKADAPPEGQTVQTNGQKDLRRKLQIRRKPTDQTGVRPTAAGEVAKNTDPVVEHSAHRNIQKQDSANSSVAKESLNQWIRQPSNRPTGQDQPRKVSQLTIPTPTQSAFLRPQDKWFKGEGCEQSKSGQRSASLRPYSKWGNEQQYSSYRCQSTYSKRSGSGSGRPQDKWCNSWE